MDYSIYTLASLFLIYSFLGWCAEVIFVVLDTHAFDNRGFLRGPVCPIYGFGIILVVSCLNPLAGTWIRLFFASVALTTALELVVGIFLKKVFHHEWWNYDEFRFNLGGYICLRFSLLWGLGCLFVVKLLHPLVYTAVTITPKNFGRPLLWFFGTVFMIDLIVTICSFFSYTRRLKALQAIEERLHQLSDELGISLCGSVTAVMSVIDRQHWDPDQEQQAQEARKLLMERIPLLIKKNHVHQHILRAFSFLHKEKYKAAIADLKRYLLRTPSK